MTSSQAEHRDRVARNVGLVLLALVIAALLVFLSGTLRPLGVFFVVAAGLLEMLGEAHHLRRILRQLIYGERLV